MYGAGLSSATDGKFHNHDGQAKEQQAQHIDKHKATAAVLSGEPGELPNVAATDGAARRQHDKAQPAAQSLSLVHCRSLLPKLKNEAIVQQKLETFKPK